MESHRAWPDRVSTISGSAVDDGGARSGVFADALLAAVGDVLQRYETALIAVNSRLLGDDDIRGQVLTQGRRIVEDVAGFVRRDDGPAPVRSFSLAQDIGASRANNRIHPSESLRAAGLLFESIGTVVAALPGDEQHRMTAMIAANRVISRRIRSAASTYVGTLLNTIEHSNADERRRLSRELHDRIGGNVAAAQRQADLLCAGTTDLPEKARERAGLIESTLRTVLVDIERLITDLRTWEPENSLEESLLAYLGGAEPDLSYQVDVNGDEGGLPGVARDTTFLIVREAIRNTLQHARADRMVVQVNIAPHELYAMVEDNGIGMCPDPGALTATSAGTSSMRERAALLGGHLVVTSAPGAGTRVELLLPIGQDE